jgi:hypothetical protein
MRHRREISKHSHSYSNTNQMATTRPPMLGNVCEIRRPLAADFAIASRLYAEAVVMLTWKAITDRRQFESLRLAVEEARAKAEQARLQFEQHVDRHGCSG